MLQARLIIGILFCMLLGTVASAYVNQQMSARGLVTYNLNCGFQFYTDETLNKPQMQVCTQPDQLIPVEFEVADYLMLVSGVKKFMPVKIQGVPAYLDRSIATLNSESTTLNPCVVHHNLNNQTTAAKLPEPVQKSSFDIDEIFKMAKAYFGHSTKKPQPQATPIPEVPISCLAYDEHLYEKPDATKIFATQIMEAEKNGGVNAKFEKFMELYSPLALFVEKKSGVSAQVFLIQIGIESSWGTYQAATELNNVGGLGHTWCESARTRAVSETGKPIFNGPVAYGDDPIHIECGGRSEVGSTYFKFANIEDYVRMWMHTYFLSKDHKGIEARMQVCLTQLKEKKASAINTAASLQGYASAPGYIAKINGEISGKKALLDKYLSKPLCVN